MSQADFRGDAGGSPSKNPANRLSSGRSYPKAQSTESVYHLDNRVARQNFKVAKADPPKFKTSDFGYCQCGDPPLYKENEGQHKYIVGQDKYKHIVDSGSVQLATDFYYVAAKDENNMATRKLRAVPQQSIDIMGNPARFDSKKNNILFLDFNFLYCARVADESRTFLLNYKRSAFEPLEVGRGIPVQDWSEGVRQLEEAYGMVLWQFSVKGEF